jgi:hypothetical protein
MSDDLEQFLQRAAQRRRQRSDPSIVIIDERNADVVVPEVVHPEAVPRRRSLGSESIGEHVDRHMDQQAFSTRAAEMGDHIEDAQQDMDQHIHEMFDHKLGNLATQNVDDPDSISDDLPKVDVQPHWVAEMLKNPETLRQAVVLNEIMRPAFRRMQ